MTFKYEPLPGSFMIVGMLGFVVSLIYWNSGKLSPPWGFTLALLSTIFFIASIMSLRKSIEIDKEELKNKRSKKKRTLKK